MQYFKDLNQKLKAAYTRFPIVLTWAIIGSIFCMVVPFRNLFGVYEEITLTLILGVSWFLGMRFLIESLNLRHKNWLIFIPLILLGFFYWDAMANLRNSSELLYFKWWLLMLSGHVFLFFAPFVKEWNTAAYWNYLKDIFTAIGRSTLFSLVLYLGLLLALLATEALFQLDFGREIYSNIFIFCLGIVNTLMYTYDFPRNIQDKTEIHFSKALEVFVKNILIPLIALYFLILYVYAFKILFSWELPRGWVSGLILGLTVVGLVVHIIVYPVRHIHSSSLLQKFYPWFFILLLPLLPLLAIAAYRRISEYGFTESRYLLMVLGFWILANILYLLISKQKQLRVLPISVFILAILSLFGPWGAVKLSLKSQKKEFAKVYDRIDFDKREISVKDSRQFQDILNYMHRRNRINDLDDILGFEISGKYLDNYRPGYLILQDLNLKTIYEKTDQEGVEQVIEAKMSLYHNFTRNEIIEKIISDYDYYGELELGVRAQNGAYRFYQKEEKLHLSKNDSILFTLNLKDSLKELTQIYHPFHTVKPEKLEFHISNEQGEFDLIFKKIYFVLGSEEFNINEARAVLFYRLKESNIGEP